MSVQARSLARAGYAVVVPELRGHGRNRVPFAFRTLDRPAGLLDDLDAAVLYARTRPHFDAERVAVAGYGMGAAAALAYGGREPSVSAIVGISGGGFPAGPYPVPNVLLVWAAGEPDDRRARYREIGAELAGLQRLVLDRTYGEPARGTGVRLSEVEATDHLTVPYSTETSRRVLYWLRATLGPGIGKGQEPVLDGRFGWSALGFLAAAVVLWGLVAAIAPMLPRGSLPAVLSPLGNLTVLVVGLLISLLLFAAGDAVATPGPFGFIPLAAGRDLIGFLAVSGGMIWVWLTLRGQISTRGLGELRSYWSAGLLLLFSYLTIGAVMQPILGLWPAPHRLLWCAVCAVVCLPYFGATEWLLRGHGPTGVWLPVVGKLLTLGVLFIAAGFGFLPYVLFLGIGAIAVAFLLLEVFACRLSRVAPAPWVPALFQAGWVGWAVGTLFPFEG
jgi:pimeloyl-ACP methyl ester carboxylesterase